MFLCYLGTLVNNEVGGKDLPCSTYQKRPKDSTSVFLFLFSFFFLLFFPFTALPEIPHATKETRCFCLSSLTWNTP